MSEKSSNPPPKSVQPENQKPSPQKPPAPTESDLNLVKRSE